jgi:7-cyano-7-deazaguanine reductase
MTHLPDTLLGRAVEHEPPYSPDLLTPVARSRTRAALGVDGPLPFVGSDRWTGWELSWLEPGGKPRIAVLRAIVPADSPNLIESKSFKIYLNSHARERYATPADLATRLLADLSACAGAPVAVELIEAADFARLTPAAWAGESLDAIAVAIEPTPEPAPGLIRVDTGLIVAEHLYSDLFKSNCPVTGQPDWASVRIAYAGPALDRAGLLAYLCSFREVREFHEQCVERIFLDLWRHAHPQRLAVEARFTRRGGLDINPYRASTGASIAADLRDWRQ